jgi:diguanylate cyclase (GGDEF)-like protein/PAS domain S-box-containing protein
MDLHESEERFRQLAENIQEVFWMTNVEKSRMLYISPGYERIWGRSCQSLYENPREWLEAIHPNDRERVLKAALDKQVNGTYDEEYQIIRLDRTVRWIRDRAFPVKDQNGRVYRIAGVAEDITERKKTEGMIRQLAYYDPLTNLPNRVLLQDRLRKAILAGQRENHPVALILMDLDRFKEINDTLGHHCGDLLLQQVGTQLKSVLWKPDQVARMGGDEFAVLLPRIRAVEDIYLVIRKIRHVLETRFIIEEIPVLVESSIGVAFYPDHGPGAENLLQRADVAMYEAKKKGLEYAIYAPELDRHSPRRLALMAELRRAIEQDELFMHYQPMVSLKTHRVIGVEALVRWQHPEYGFIPPDQFIEPAERTGLIRGLTLWILNAVQEQSRIWHQVKQVGLTVSVNLSARNLQDPEIARRIIQMIQECRVAPDTLSFEITETAIMNDPERVMEFIKTIRSLGVWFSIDDFGTGYSSLANLKKLPVDEIKIDRAFVMNLLKNSGEAAIVRSVIDMAHNFNLRVVAEGVENKETYDRLVELGCDEAQGYYMAKPMPVEELTRWLSESPWGI